METEFIEFSSFVARLALSSLDGIGFSSEHLVCTPLFLCLRGKVSSNCPLKKVTLDPCQTKVSVGHGCCPNDDTGFTGSVKMEWVTCGPW